MIPTYFRALILISVAAGVAGSFVDFLFPSLVSAALSVAVESEPPPALLAGNPWVLLAILGPFFLVGIASTIGLFYFRRWARTLSLVVLGAGFILTPFLGATLSSGLSYALIEFSTTTWGAALAIAYYSPLSQRFHQAESVHVR
jgi:hypothetical protein